MISLLCSSFLISRRYNLLWRGRREESPFCTIIIPLSKTRVSIRRRFRTRRARGSRTLDTEVVEHFASIVLSAGAMPFVAVVNCVGLSKLAAIFVIEE